jgi:hypothetical protein
MKCAAKTRAAPKKLTIEHAQRLAASRGGECLSDTYVGNKATLLWRCSQGHEWRTSYNAVDRKRWCPKCANEKKANLLRTNTIEVAQEVAARKGGECLSEEYHNSYTHLRWRCHNGHEWAASLNKIKDLGRWCPSCSRWRREGECRKIFERLSQKKFSPATPSFLQGLRYDGFCPELRIAFEYNGSQHYEEVPYFHREAGAFERQLERDEKKVELSAENEIALIVIPHWVDHLEPFIQRQLYLLGVPGVERDQFMKNRK